MALIRPPPYEYSNTHTHTLHTHTHVAPAPLFEYSNALYPVHYIHCTTPSHTAGEEEGDQEEEDGGGPGPGSRQHIADSE
jgi:hypothetical protein